MKTHETWINFWNNRVRHFTLWDIKLVQIWTAAWILLFAKLFPPLVELSPWWFVLVIALCAPWVIYVVFLRQP